MKGIYKTYKAGYFGWIFLILFVLYFLFHPNTRRILKTRPIYQEERVSASSHEYMIIDGGKLCKMK